MIAIARHGHMAPWSATRPSSTLTKSRPRQKVEYMARYRVFSMVPHVNMLGCNMAARGLAVLAYLSRITSQGNHTRPGTIEMSPEFCTMLSARQFRPQRIMHSVAARCSLITDCSTDESTPVSPQAGHCLYNAVTTPGMTISQRSQVVT